MSYLDNLTKEQIQSQFLPLRKILTDSCYYPASAFDGQLVKHASNDIVNFVYCDHSQGETALLDNLQNRPFYGYLTLAVRKVNQEELVPNGWLPQLPPNFSPDAYSRIKRDAKIPFANWFIFERKAEFDAQHGPQRFSLLYVGGEGVATYQALFWTNKIAPKALAIIQPGHGFGGNWTDFTKAEGHLNWVAVNNPAGVPAKLYFGGVGTGYAKEFDWAGYVYERTINPYYSDSFGEVTVWRAE